MKKTVNNAGRLKECIILAHDQFNKTQRKKTIKYNHYKNLPFLLYKKQLNAIITMLEKYHNKLATYSTPYAQKLKLRISLLLGNLERLNQYMLTFDEYHQVRLVADSTITGLTWNVFKIGFANLSTGILKGVSSLL